MFPRPFNPDEAQMVANTLRIRRFGYNWDSVDGTTVGPLNAILMALPLLCGIQPTLQTSRLISVLLLGTGAFITVGTIRRVGSRTSAGLMLLLLVTVYGLAANSDFLQSSSEIPAVTLLAVATRLVTSMITGQGRRVWRFSVLGTCLTAALLAKLQTAPIVLLLGTIGLAVASRSGRRKYSMAAYALGLAIPTLPFLLPLAAHGHLRDFWASYIEWARSYVLAPLGAQGLLELVYADERVKWAVSCMLIGLGLGLSARSVRQRGNGVSLSWQTDWVGVFVLAQVAASVVSVVRPGNIFPHYAHLLFQPLALAAGWALSIGRTGPGTARSCRTAICGLAGVMLLTAGPSRYRVWLDQSRLAHRVSLATNLSSGTGDLFNWMPLDTRIGVVWGWMPNWYAAGGLIPGTRETHTNAQIRPSRMRDYFRTRFLMDFDTSTPEVVVDSAIGDSFVFSDPDTEGVGAFPGLAERLKSRYVPLTSGNRNCATTYVSRKIAHRLAESNVNFSVAADAGYSPAYPVTALTDNSLTEDTCIDYWLLPDGAPGTLTLTLDKVSRIREVLLLNTANGGYWDRAAGRVELSLVLRGKILWTTPVTVKPYPNWTRVTVPDSLCIDRVQVSLESSRGLGGGLNEIKLSRALDSSSSSEVLDKAIGPACEV